MAEVLSEPGTGLDLLAPVDGLHQSGSGTITGAVWLQSGDRSFPERGWSDISVAVVLTFVRNTRALAVARPGSPVEVPFFDGPFSAVLTRNDGDRLECSTRSDRPDLRWTAVTAWSHWQESLYETGRILLEGCQDRGFSSHDTEELAKLVRLWFSGQVTPEPEGPGDIRMKRGWRRARRL